MGEDTKDTTGRIGLSFLWTLGSPYKRGGTGLGSRSSFFREGVLIINSHLFISRLTSIFYVFKKIETVVFLSTTLVENVVDLADVGGLLHHDNGITFVSLRDD